MLAKQLLKSSLPLLRTIAPIVGRFNFSKKIMKESKYESLQRKATFNSDLMKFHAKYFFPSKKTSSIISFLIMLVILEEVRRNLIASYFFLAASKACFLAVDIFFIK